MTLHFHPFSPDLSAQIRAGGADANGQRAERGISDGVATPCRSCLRDVPKGEGVLIFAARPFPTLQAYAETGPALLCHAACTPWPGTGKPPILGTSPDYLLKAYGRDDRIVYGTGRITPADDLESYARALLSRDDVAYVDVRSARNNCFLTRITQDE